jgi:hypothetical protein
VIYSARSAHYKTKVSQLKTQNSQVFFGDDEYNFIDDEYFPYYTLAQAAMMLKIRTQRMSRLLRILQIPIHKIGTLVLLDQDAYDRIEQALKRKEVKRGRKPNAE